MQITRQLIGGPKRTAMTAPEQPVSGYCVRYQDGSPAIAAVEMSAVHDGYAFTVTLTREDLLELCDVSEGQLTLAPSLQDSQAWDASAERATASALGQLDRINPNARNTGELFSAATPHRKE